MIEEKEERAAAPHALPDSGSDHAFLSSVNIQRRVIGALLLREVLTRYGRHNIGFLWLFVEPMLFTLGVTALWSFLKTSHSTFPIAAFAVTGYSSILLWRNMPSRTIGGIGPNAQLLYHRNVKILDIYVARIVLEGCGATVSFIVLALFFSFIGWMSLPEDILTVLIGWAFLAWFGAALALLLGALAEKYEIIDRVWHIITYLLFPLSGAAFTVDSMPAEAQRVVLVFPMVHGVEMVREGYFGSAFKPHYSVAYLGSICMILTLLGMAATRIASREVNPE